LSDIAILERYDAEMRSDPPEREGVSHTCVNGIVRTTGQYNCIGYHRFSFSDANQRVAQEIAFFSKHPGRLEWKIHWHDEPWGLTDILTKAGFEPEEPETVLVLDLSASALAFQSKEGLEILRVSDRAALGEMIVAATRAFPNDLSWISTYENRLNDETLALYVAYLDGKPVGTGRLELPQNRTFAGAYIGSVVPEHRGKGIYRALVGARAADAKLRGFRYLFTEARETSRPILERLGFTPITTVQGWIKTF